MYDTKLANSAKSGDSCAKVYICTKTYLGYSCLSLQFIYKSIYFFVYNLSKNLSIIPKTVLETIDWKISR